LKGYTNIQKKDWRSAFKLIGAERSEIFLAFLRFRTFGNKYLSDVKEQIDLPIEYSIAF
jgi:hypothetical protein